MNIRTILDNTKTAFIGSWPAFLIMIGLIFVLGFFFIGVTQVLFADLVEIFSEVEGETVGTLPTSVQEEMTEIFVGLFVVMIFAFIGTILVMPFYYTGASYAQIDTINGGGNFLSKAIEGGKEYYGRSMGIFGLAVALGIVLWILFIPFQCCGYAYLFGLLFSQNFGGNSPAEMTQQMQIQSILPNLAFLFVVGLYFTVFETWLLTSISALATGKTTFRDAFTSIITYFKHSSKSRKIIRNAALALYVIFIITSIFNLLQNFIPQELAQYASYVLFPLMYIVGIGLYFLKLAFFSSLANEYYNVKNSDNDDTFTIDDGTLVDELKGEIVDGNGLA